jgi:hypothetical protein
MTVTMGVAMLVEQPAGPVDMVSRKRIGMLVLAIIKGGLGLALAQIRDGTTTTTMLVEGATRTELLHMAEWHVVVLMLIYFNKQCKRW